MQFLDLSNKSLESLRKDLALGYRNCVYKQFRKTGGYIFFMGWLKDGSPFEFKYKWKCRAGYVDESAEKDNASGIDIFNRRIKYRSFNTNVDRSKFIKENGEYVNFVDVLPPEQEFLIALFSKDVEKTEFNTIPIRIHYIDIETEISDSGAFEYPASARNKINIMTVYDTATETFYTWSSDKVSEERIQKTSKLVDKPCVVFDQFATEESMLRHYISWHSNNYPDAWCSWNGRAYDIPYLVRRMENLVGQEEPRRLSPVNDYYIKVPKFLEDLNNPNSARITVYVKGIQNLDELLLYRDKFNVRGSLDGGFNLSNVGITENLGGKYEFEGSLKHLYLTDWDSFYEYNVRDVSLLFKIEEKCKLIDLTRKLCGIGLCNYENIYGSISYIIGSVYIFAKEHMNGKIFPNFLYKPAPYDWNYEGAYVFPSAEKFVKDGIATIDFNSLYPNSIIAMNISPETYVGKLPSMLDINDLPDIVDIYLPNQQRKEVTKEHFQKLLDKKVLVTKNHTIFLKPSAKVGVLPAWCKYYYAQRKKAQRDKEKAHAAGKRILESQLNTIQLGLKTALNSLYGLTGAKFSPIGNLDLAQSITKTGRFCNMEAAKFITEHFEKEYGQQSHDYKVILNGDTDSIFINIAPITKALRTEFGYSDKLRDWPDEGKVKLWGIVEKFIEKKVTPHVQNLLKVACFAEDTSMIRYGLEYISSAGIFQMKKTYAVHKIIGEGPEIIDDYKYVGIELKKATVTSKMKEYLAEIYNKALSLEWGFRDFETFIHDSYDEFETLPIEDIAQWKGYETPAQREGFLQLKKGASGIAKAVNAYNDMLEELGISKKYEQLLLGDKARFIYLAPNKYGLDAIAFKDHWPEEFNELFKPDYKIMFDKNVLSPLRSFMKCMNWSGVSMTQNLLFDISDL